MPGVKKEPVRVDVPLDRVQELLTKSEKEPSKRVVELLAKYQNEYPKWMAYMIDGGFNILLHGFGSKQRMLDQFVEKEIKRHGYWHMVVRGYAMESSGDQILKSLAKNLNIELKTGQNDIESAETIVADLDRRKGKSQINIIIVIHSLDGIPLRDKTTQSALSKLAECKSLRLICSIDHVNTTLLWDQAVLTRFRFLWMETPTYDTYSQEIMAGDSKILGLKSTNTSRSHSLASLESLWASLTKNSQSVLVELVRKYFSLKDPSPSVAFWDLYQICRSEFLVSSEASLRHIMTEFRDHSVVVQRKSGDGSEVYALLVPKKLIIKFLEEKGYSDLISEEDNMKDDEILDRPPQEQWGGSDSGSDQY